MDDLQVMLVSSGTVRVTAAPHLCGPPDVLQGGLAAAALARAAAAVTGGTPTRVVARLHRPTPTGTPLVATVRGAAPGDDLDVPGATDTVDVVLGSPADPTTDQAGDEPEPTITGRVVLDVRPDGADDHDDLVRIAHRDPLPRPTAAPAAPDCVVCGASNPQGLHVFPSWFDDGAVAEAWEGDDDVAGPGGMFVRPEVVAALLDCPTVWACRDACRHAGFGGALLGGFDVTWYSRLPVGESVRIGAVLDDADGRKLHARAAMVGRDGMVYAVARALQVGVEEMPGADPELDPFGADHDD